MAIILSSFDHLYGSLGDAITNAAEHLQQENTESDFHMSDRLDRLRAELRGILQRGIEALPVADRFVDELERWEKPSDLCHDCVDTWLAEGRDGRAVRGWLIDGFGSRSYRLVAHSMVRTSDGSLLDVTLRRAAYKRRFVEHPTTIDGFFAQLCANPPAHELWVDVG